jgi:hypothetical protein
MGFVKEAAFQQGDRSAHLSFVSFFVRSESRFFVPTRTSLALARVEAEYHEVGGVGDWQHKARGVVGHRKFGSSAPEELPWRLCALRANLRYRIGVVLSHALGRLRRQSNNHSKARRADGTCA